MTRRHPRAFPLDDRTVYDAYVAGRMSAALAVGVRLGLFDRLDRSPATAQELVEEFELSARGVRSYLAATKAMGLLLEEEGRWSLSSDASAYLVRGKAGSLWGLIDMEMDHFLSPPALLEAMKTGNPSVYEGEDPWEAHEQDSGTAEAFTAAMHSVSERPAAGVAEVIELEAGTRLLDVGGGSGALSIAIAKAHPEVKCTVLDLAVVKPLCERYAEEASLSDRVDAVAGDMFGEPLPSGYNAVLYSQILHDWSFAKCRKLLAQAFDALPSGGRVFIHEKLVDDDGQGPLANALVNLDMLVWTEGQQFKEAELRELCTEAGFEAFECQNTAGYWSLSSAKKP